MKSYANQHLRQTKPNQTKIKENKKKEKEKKEEKKESRKERRKSKKQKKSKKKKSLFSIVWTKCASFVFTLFLILNNT